VKQEEEAAESSAEAKQKSAEEGVEAMGTKAEQCCR